MAQPPVSEVTQELYDSSLRPMAYSDEVHDYALLHLLEACAGFMQLVRDLGYPQNGSPGWSQVVDIDRCPLIAQNWLAQFVGIIKIPKIPTITNDPEELRQKQRDYIKGLPGFRRGTPAAIEAEVKSTLTGNQTIIFRERPGGFAYRLEIRTYTAETPSEADTLAAIIRQKPAGILLDYDSITGQDYQLLYTNHSPYSDMFGDYTDYQEVVLDLP